MAMSTCEVYDEIQKLNFFDPRRLLATTMWEASALRTSTKPGHFKHAALTDAFLFLAISASSRVLTILSFVHSSSNSSPASFRQTAIIAQAFSSSAGVIVLGAFQLHMKPAACLIMYSKLLRTICFGVQWWMQARWYWKRFHRTSCSDPFILSCQTALITRLLAVISAWVPWTWMVFAGNWIVSTWDLFQYLLKWSNNRKSCMAALVDMITVKAYPLVLLSPELLQCLALSASPLSKIALYLW